MILLDEHNPFASGPATLDVGGVGLRHATQPASGSDGEAIAPQGRTGRTLTQTGTLYADDSAALAAQAAAIEALLDGRPRTLTDDAGRAWPQVVMLSFEPGVAQRHGRRHALPYTITYRQPRPLPADTTGVTA